MNGRDEQLLDVLAVALGPVPAAEPTRAEVLRFRRHLDGDAPESVRARLWRIPRPLTAAAAGLVVLGSASAAAAATGAVMPEPVRVAVRAVGLPVDSPQLADARTAIARLRDALDARPRHVEDIRARAQELRDRLGHLSADDRLDLDAQARFLLVEADNALAPPPMPIGSPPAAIAPARTPAPAGHELPAADDHGHASAAAPLTGSDDHTTASTEPTRSGDGGGGGDDTTTTLRTDTSGRDGGSSGSGSGGPGPSSDGGSHDGGSSGGGSSDGGGHSGPG